MNKAITKRYIIGIDEVGRGSLAGPVTVAAVLIPKGWRNKSGLTLKDSKKLSSSVREAWFGHLKKTSRSFRERGSPGAANVSYAISHVQPSTIDKINISNAANLAAFRTIEKLSRQNPAGYSGLVRGALRGEAGKPAIFLDGGLYMRNSIRRTSLLFKSRTVTKGDEKIPAIALASIVAKVRRDALMKRLHKKHTHYGFDVHKGYGTKRHQKAIKKYGLSEAHRVSFC